MKMQWNKKYTSIAIHATVTAAIIIVIFCCLYNYSYFKDLYFKAMELFSPIIAGIVIAFLINPIFKLMENKIFSFVEKKKKHFKLRRALAVIVSYLVVIGAISAFLFFIGPRIVASYTGLQAKASGYISTLLALVEDFVGESGFLREQYDSLMQYVNFDTIKDLLTGSFDVILGGTSVVVGIVNDIVFHVKNLFLGLVLSIYFLVSKEKLIGQLNKLLCAIFSRSSALRIKSVLKKTHNIFGGFVIGKLIESTIVAVITFFVLGIFNMPYYPLVSLIVGITNVIPFFGPFIGAVPSAFIIFVEDPSKSFWFLIIILAIQLLNYNLISPKILGSRTGLSSLWVIISITVMSGFFGFTGMFVGVPFFAVIYALVKEYIEKRLRKKNLADSTSSYMEGGEEDENNEI